MGIKRGDCARLLRDHLDAKAIVIGGLGTSGRAWRDQNARHATYYASDPMGIGVALALGLALARPERQILYLGGDGDLVMNLGSLLTVVGSDVRNLKIAIFANGRYETGGGLPLAGAEHYSLVEMARAAGFPFAVGAADASSLEARVIEFLAQDGLAFLAFDVDIEASPYGPPPLWSQAEDRAVFMRRLAEEP